MTRGGVNTPVSGRKRWYLAATALTGVGLFVWTIASVGPHEIARQLQAAGPILPLILTIAALRFWLQAAGWRLAMPAAQRPTWQEAFAAVVAGEAAGYFAWGAVSREPMKAWLVGHRIPEREALSAAVIERLIYTLAAAVLIAVSIALAAIRYHFIGRFVVGALTGAVVALLLLRRYRTRLTSSRVGTATLISIGAFAAAQELTNLIEAWLILSWLGAAPAMAPVIVLEGIGRLLNGAGQFIPGKLGVTEAATTALAQGLQLGSAHGLGLALVRRARSLVWGAIGIGMVAHRAATTRMSTT